jgi:hypothetical protein
VNNALRESEEFLEVRETGISLEHEASVDPPAGPTGPDVTLRTAEAPNSTLIGLEELLAASQAPTNVLGDAEDWIESSIPPDDVPGLTMSAEESDLWFADFDGRPDEEEATLEEESKGDARQLADGRPESDQNSLRGPEAYDNPGKDGGNLEYPCRILPPQYWCQQHHYCMQCQGLVPEQYAVENDKGVVDAPALLREFFPDLTPSQVTAVAEPFGMNGQPSVDKLYQWALEECPTCGIQRDHHTGGHSKDACPTKNKDCYNCGVTGM